MHRTTGVLLLRSSFNDLVLNIKHISLYSKTSPQNIFPFDKYFVSYIPEHAEMYVGVHIVSIAATI